MTEKPKTPAEAMNEVNKAFRDLWYAIREAVLQTERDINAAWKKGIHK